MKILLTGGSGFVGRHVMSALSGRYTIVAPAHGELDVTDSAAVEQGLRRGRFDAVIHAAVQGGPTVSESTLRGFWNLHQQAGLVHRIIYFGSGAEYGKHRDLAKAKEETIGDVTPLDSYGFAKLLCTTLARRATNIVNLRLFGIYGPFEGYLLKFISNSVVKALLGEPIVIRQNVLFDYLWIDDLMSLIPKVLDGQRRFADLNVTPTRSVSLTEIASIVLREAGRQPVFEVEQPGLNFEYTGSNEQVLSVYPGFTFTPIEEGVRRLMAYYRERLETVDREAVVADEYRRKARTRQPAQPGEIPK